MSDFSWDVTHRWDRSIAMIRPETIVAFGEVHKTPFTVDDISWIVVEQLDPDDNLLFGVLHLRDGRFACVHVRYWSACDTCGHKSVRAAAAHVSRKLETIVRLGLTRSERETLGIDLEDE